jgi:hypothetical protein
VVALAFASFLDARRFVEAQQCLALDCIYEPAGTARIDGAPAIIQSYRDSDARGLNALDELHYTSCIEWADAETVSVEFTDYLRRNGLSHTFVSRQLFTVREGVIVHIVGVETAAARRALQEFLRACDATG